MEVLQWWVFLRGRCSACWVLVSTLAFTLYQIAKAGITSKLYYLLSSLSLPLMAQESWVRFLFVKLQPSAVLPLPISWLVCLPLASFS